MPDFVPEPVVPGIEIEQDQEIDHDGELCGSINVFWAKRHGLDQDKFIRAVIDHCLEPEGGVPAISWEDELAEVWQHLEPVGDNFEYHRSNESSWSAGRKAEPITLLDVDRRGRGARRCQVHDCREPWSRSTPVQVCIDANDDDAARMIVYMTLCRTHVVRFPKPSYRVCMVPVGATIELPAPAEVAR